MLFPNPENPRPIFLTHRLPPCLPGAASQESAWTC
ncbi:hypothetical protein H4V98_003708 [Polaromonas sp. CG_23.6]|nr:hypothetical protein [Polaromonas sp. CG_23.6]